MFNGAYAPIEQMAFILRRPSRTQPMTWKDQRNLDYEFNCSRTGGASLGKHSDAAAVPDRALCLTNAFAIQRHWLLNASGGHPQVDRR